MKTIDKIIIGVPAAVSGITVLVTKLGASLLLVGSVISSWLGLRKEEVKEAVLAYYFLLTANGKLTKKELDRRIENWLAEKWNCHIDFEIGDAVNKLERLGLIHNDAGYLRCLPLNDAKRQLDPLFFEPKFFF